MSVYWDPNFFFYLGFSSVHKLLVKMLDSRSSHYVLQILETKAQNGLGHMSRVSRKRGGTQMCSSVSWLMFPHLLTSLERIAKVIANS